ncbi:MAG: thioredoxin family protein [Saprospiraceae bacterium]|nr:thioredoxin family protein [Saprospiraceae bacterium]
MPVLLVFFLLINMIQPACQPVELGKVNWLRSLDAAREKSKSDNKPIFILFQEVPGCHTCRNYGSEILSHPLLVEAIETYFVPLCIYNNKGGEDAKALKLFNEPAWNNPVVRITDSNLKELVMRLSGNYSMFMITNQIVSAMIKIGERPPEYLLLLEEQAKAEYTGIQSLYAQMYCFWSGEKQYSRLPGIVSTRAGFMSGHEVVEIQYNPKNLSANEIVRFGKMNQVADKIYSNDKLSITEKITIESVSDFKVDRENKYYLYNSNYKYIPMLPLQALRVNNLLSEKQPVDHLLSPRQLERLHEQIGLPEKKRKNMISEDMIKSWYR